MSRIPLKLQNFPGWSVSQYRLVSIGRLMFISLSLTVFSYESLLASDVSTTMIVQPGPVVDFLINNQNVKDPYLVDWAKVSEMVRFLFALS